MTKTDAQLEQLQRLTSDVEFAAVQKDVLYGLQQGTAVLKQIHVEMGGIEKVERLLEEGAEARAYQREVSDLLAGGLLSNQDEDEVEDELEAMERELGVAPKEEVVVVVLPDVPVREVDDGLPEQVPARERAKAREARRTEELLAA